jgi:serine/threonine protein kinase
VKELHKAHNIIHRDIKPENLRVNPGENRLYLLDFGAARRFKGGESGAHIPYKEGIKLITGTPEYASVRNHEGIEQSRRDDVESMLYSIFEIYVGHLPWSHSVKFSSITNFGEIKEKKV